MRAKLAATEPIESRDELSGKVADMYILVNDMSGRVEDWSGEILWGSGG